MRGHSKYGAGNRELLPRGCTPSRRRGAETGSVRMGDIDASMRAEQRCDEDSAR